MIIFLFGQDLYRMKEKLNEIVGKYKKVHKSGLNLRYLESPSFSDFKDSLSQSSMFDEKKLIVLTGPFLNKDFKDDFLKQAEGFVKSDDIIVFFQESEADKRSSLFKFLEKNAKCQEFSPITGLKLKAWIKKEVENHGAEINPLALEKLIDYTGNDLWRLKNEIMKLASYSKNIEVEDVELLTRPKIETDIFKTIDAVASKNKKEALNLLHKHLEKGDSPLYLLSMINFQFKNLLIIKDLIEKHIPYYIILKKSGLHPFVVKKSYYQSQQFSFEELKKIYQKIFEADFNIKTGRIEPALGLDLLIAGI